MYLTGKMLSWNAFNGFGVASFWLALFFTLVFSPLLQYIQHISFLHQTNGAISRLIQFIFSFASDSLMDAMLGENHSHPFRSSLLRLFVYFLLALSLYVKCFAFQVYESFTQW